jgi:hypothetical protein
MPLLDHFHPPLSSRYQWQSFYANWATRLADAITELIPRDFLAEEHTHADAVPDTPTLVGSAPPAAHYTIPSVLPDPFEVHVFATEGGRKLVGAIELISPGNKDRPDERRAFASKCAAYLQKGVSVILIDIVTSRRANLHNELIRLLNSGEAFEMSADAGLYAVAYRPVLRQERAEIDVWPATFRVGEPLPQLPLRLTGDLFIPVDFEAAYQEACRRRRLT